MAVATVKEGDPAPDFSLPDQNGTRVSLKALQGRPVVLYFYPKDDTPGCTREACAFRDAYRAVQRTGAVVLGVSLDDPKSHRAFIEKYALPFPLLSDQDAAVSKAYQVYKQKSMYGKTYWGIERSTFVIDRSGIITASFRKVKVDGHVDSILAVLTERVA